MGGLAQGKAKYFRIQGAKPLISSKFYCKEVIDKRLDKSCVGTSFNKRTLQTTHYCLEDGFDSQMNTVLKRMYAFRKKKKPLTIVIHKLTLNPSPAFSLEPLCHLKLEFLTNDITPIQSYGVFEFRYYANQKDMMTLSSIIPHCITAINRNFNKLAEQTDLPYPFEKAPDVTASRLDSIPELGCYLSFEEVKRGRVIPNAKVRLSKSEVNGKPVQVSNLAISPNSIFAQYISDGKDLYIRCHESIFIEKYLKVTEFGRYLYFQTVKSSIHGGYIIDSITGEIKLITLELLKTLCGEDHKSIFEAYQSTAQRLDDRRQAIRDLNDALR